MPPDSLPVRVLLGKRATLLLTSPLRPKAEEYAQNDQLPTLLGVPKLVLPDSLRAGLHLAKPLQLYVVTFVDETGAPVTSDLPYMPQGLLTDAVIARIAEMTSHWRFKPAVKLSHEVRAFATVPVMVEP